MQDLYSEKDLQTISGQLKKRYLLLGLVLAVLLAALILSMVIRVEWLSIILFILFFGTDHFRPHRTDAYRNAGI